MAGTRFVAKEDIWYEVHYGKGNRQPHQNNDLHLGTINDGEACHRSRYLNANADVMIRVSKGAACMIGTSANLPYGYWIRLIDLLYALMLPSGNDAACLIA